MWAREGFTRRAVIDSPAVQHSSWNQLRGCGGKEAGIGSFIRYWRSGDSAKASVTKLNLKCIVFFTILDFIKGNNLNLLYVKNIIQLKMSFCLACCLIFNCMLSKAENNISVWLQNYFVYFVFIIFIVRENENLEWKEMVQFPK